MNYKRIAIVISLLLIVAGSAMRFFETVFPHIANRLLLFGAIGTIVTILIHTAPKRRNSEDAE